MRSITLSQLAIILDGSLHSEPEYESIVAKGVNVDSRLVQPGNLFFALPGAQTDGHDFLQAAFANGAVAAVVSRPILSLSSAAKFPLLVVKDTLEALQKLTRYFLALQDSIVVAVTGSVGKTTTKDLIATLLRQKYRVAASPGNSNSQIGLPLTILNHTVGDEDVLILEMGMTHPGQIAKLVQLAPPDIAVITSVELVHAVNFDSLAEIGQAKAEIFSHPRTKLGIIPRDSSLYPQLLESGQCPKLTFSVRSKSADYSIQSHSADGFQIDECREISPVLPNLVLPGIHNLHNFLAAIVVARHLKLSWEEIKQAIPQLILPERRLQSVEKDGVLFINDAYNANATSVKAALGLLPSPKNGGRKIAVIGEMLELGKFSVACHRDIGLTALNHVDLLFCLGSECIPTQQSWLEANKPAPLYLDRTDLVQELRKQIKPGDVVLLKGSRPKQMWKVIEEL